MGPVEWRRKKEKFPHSTAVCLWRGKEEVRIFHGNLEPKANTYSLECCWTLIVKNICLIACLSHFWVMLRLEQEQHEKKKKFRPTLGNELNFLSVRPKSKWLPWCEREQKGVRWRRWAASTTIGALSWSNKSFSLALFSMLFAILSISCSALGLLKRRV